MTITKLRQMLDSKELSAVELTQKYLDEIKSKDDRIGAFLHVDEEKALKQARAAQEKIDSGDAQALTGIPMGIKDLICTKGMPTTCASKMLEGYIPPYSATVIKRLKAQNAIILGKTNMDEFAMGASTQSSYFKPCKNPYDMEYVPGGSSGGSAAAVASGMCTAALGSDTGGSIRQPAAFCGITGHRPTYGAVSRYGAVAAASSLDQIGPMAMSAEDCAAVLNVIAGRDGYDQTTVLGKEMDFTSKLGEGVKGIRLAIIEELFTDSIDPEVRKAIEEAARWYEQAGATVERVSIPLLKEIIPAYYLIMCAEVATNLSKFDGVRFGFRSENASTYEELIKNTRGEGFGWEVKRRIILGNYALSSGYYEAYYKKAVSVANAVKAEYAKAFTQYDALISPAAATPAYRIDAVPEDPAESYLADICTVSAPLSGLPSITSPCGYTDKGLPIGFMLTGAKWSDPELLALVHQFESEFLRREAAL